MAQNLLANISSALGYSVAWTHLRQIINGILWALTVIWNKKSLRLAAFNHLFATVLDCVLGVLFLRWLLGIASIQALVDVVADATDVSL